MVKIEVSRLHKLDSGGSVKAFADITIEDSFVVKGVRILEGSDGNVFVSMPREQAKDGKWYNVIIPLSREVKEEVERVVLEEYGEGI